MPLDSNFYQYTPEVDFTSGSAPESTQSTEHILHTSNLEAIDKVSGSPDWILGVLLLIFAILAWVRVYHKKRLNQLFRAFLYKLHVQTLLRSNDSLITRVSVGLNAIYILTMTLFVYLLIQNFGISFPYSDSVNPFLTVLAIFIFLYPLKSLGLHFLGWVFHDSEKFTEYIFNVFLLNKILGLSLLPIVVLVSYFSSGQVLLLEIGMVTIALFYLYRLFRGYAIGRATAKLSQFYIFLYLCTLEILPLVVITRLVLREL